MPCMAMRIFLVVVLVVCIKKTLLCGARFFFVQGTKEVLAPMVREIKKVIEKIALNHNAYKKVYKTKRSSLMRTPFCIFNIDLFLLHGSSPLWVSKKIKSKIKISRIVYLMFHYYKCYLTNVTNIFCEVKRSVEK